MHNARIQYWIKIKERGKSSAKSSKQEQCMTPSRKKRRSVMRTIGWVAYGFLFVAFSKHKEASARFHLFQWHNIFPAKNICLDVHLFIILFIFMHCIVILEQFFSGLRYLSSLRYLQKWCTFSINSQKQSELKNEWKEAERQKQTNSRKNAEDENIFWVWVKI